MGQQAIVVEFEKSSYKALGLGVQGTHVMDAAIAFAVDGQAAEGEGRRVAFRCLPLFLDGVEACVIDCVVDDRLLARGGHASFEL